MNDPKYLEKLLNFIIETKYDDLPNSVKEQAKKCFFDLAGVMCAGAKNNSAQKAAIYVKENYPSGEYSLMALDAKTNLIGAAMANGMAANALDMDDGYSLLRGHPGAGFFGALLTAAENSGATYGDVLCAIVVAYEVSIRQGYAIRDYYGWDHSSGSYGTFATAAAIGKLLKLNKKELERALGIADFIMPVNPAKRSCYYPSMNKDGIYWGQHAGAEAVIMAKSGISGKNPVILDEKYLPYIDTLGEKYYCFDLYIKFYSCCRWAHSPIRAVSSLMEKYEIDVDNILKIDIFSFGYAGTLYRSAPSTEDEAQYNIIYPIVAQVVFGDCGPLESSTEKMLDPRIAPMIEKVEFHFDADYDKLFPGKRLSRAEITTIDGKKYVSQAYEPLGDHNNEVTIDDIANKLYKINGLYANKSIVDNFVERVLNTESNESFDKIFASIRNLARTNSHPEIKFI